uniref:Uncharacterized protein n=1 Tax=Arundo donax TaxID=35708 RepID=A0A0A9HWD4_ARUDO
MHIHDPSSPQKQDVPLLHPYTCTGCHS